MDNALYWIWLSLACIPGGESFRKLKEKFSTPENIYAQNEASIASVISSKASDYGNLINKDLSEAQSVLGFCRSKKVGILTYDDESFPTSLRLIKNPPVLLYYRGILPDFNNEICISVVGTRRISEYGRKNAFSVSRDLAEAGAVIVSGMATGNDGVAMAGALSAGARTVAIIGSGIDVCYPPQHRRLAQEIVKKGCVFTEYKPTTPPNGENFPVRNRLISGLSVATVVIEGRERSGAVIIARRAKEQERRVFALPGNVGNKNSEGSNLLIKNGAGLFTSADDIISALEKEYPGKLNPFNITGQKVNMFDYLKEYRISCVTPGDDIFKVKINKKKESPKVVEQKKESVSESDVANLSAIDAKTLALYKKIPINAEIATNDLIDNEHSLKDVMQGILKLEMMRFVTVLPGDRVSRK